MTSLNPLPVFVSELLGQDTSVVGIVLFGAFVTGYFVKLYGHWEIRSGEAKSLGRLNFLRY